VIDEEKEKEKDNNNIDSSTFTPSTAIRKLAHFDSGTTGHHILCNTACFDKRPITCPLRHAAERTSAKSAHEAT
jgi:hypothetical protein